MKKLRWFILAFALLLGLTACGRTAQSEVETVPAVVEPETAPTEMPEAETGEEITEEKVGSVEMESGIVYAKTGDAVFEITLTDNSSAEAFAELLSGGDLTVDLHDYGSFEKVGSLGTDLPRNDESITTSPGDVILYQGKQITIYYDTNTWNFTRLGRIENVTRDELLSALGAGNVSVTFSLER